MNEPEDRRPSFSRLLSEFLRGCRDLVRRKPKMPEANGGLPPFSSMDPAAVTIKVLGTLACGLALTVYGLSSKQAREVRFKIDEAKRIEARGTVNAAYWNQVTPKIVPRQPPALTISDSIESALTKDLDIRWANATFAQQHLPRNADQDFRKAILHWVDAERRLVHWCIRNKAALLAGARGVSIQEILSQPDFTADELVRLIPQRASEECEKLRLILLDLAAALTEVADMRIRLMERYPKQKFEPIQ